MRRVKRGTFGRTSPSFLPAGFKNDLEHEDSKRHRVHKNSEGLSTLINSTCQSGKISNLIATLR